MATGISSRCGCYSIKKTRGRTLRQQVGPAGVPPLREAAKSKRPPKWPLKRGALERCLLAVGLATETVVLGEARPSRRIVWRHHRIVCRQAPFVAIFLGRHIVVRAQVPLERLELLAVLEADDVVGGN